MLLRRMWIELAAYRDFSRDSHAEHVIALAGAGILLAAGDTLVVWLLAFVARDVAGALVRLGDTPRKLLLGGPLALGVLVWGIGRPWLAAHRRGELVAYREARSSVSRE